MKIELERSGGFAGIPLRRSITSDNWPLAEQTKLAGLVHASRFFDLPAEIPNSRSGADRFQYQISIEEAGARHSVKVDEASLPDTLRPLIAWLQSADKL